MLLLRYKRDQKLLRTILIHTHCTRRVELDNRLKDAMSAKAAPVCRFIHLAMSHVFCPQDGIEPARKVLYNQVMFTMSLYTSSKNKLYYLYVPLSGRCRESSFRAQPY